MPDTTQRPTPEQILADVSTSSGTYMGSWGVRNALNELAEHGYVIAHPEDVPDASEASAPYQHGWNACRNLIFGSDDA